MTERYRTGSITPGFLPLKPSFGLLCYRIRRAWAIALMDNWSGSWEPITRRKQSGEVWLWLLVAVSLFAMAGIVALIIKDNKRWEQFKAEHACKVVAKVKGDVFNTVSVDSKGQPVFGISTTPDKTGWLCDDGVTYYR